ncbi:50S ribosomal protein L33 [Erysipelothrix sp. strain 2 (EsS2-6-Brazil)]|uniref:50S ribosomal protein L33 n=1 Tax=Erysipelothrix sp. strain 2 (EsS2-6-Brazil) TaxID=2500549 RepID=UPI00190BD1BC|nr:50S ribosomal protein L33 [Erysipelothrix sp. strain 2 (EsS2-6-Brazil)]MBK2402060.1 50S ribosomal protein L33 [Erysipelothrix sp. strain 2 (EsS2-6-Brazil)]
MTNKREKVILVCTECLSRNYSTFRNHSSVTERLEIKKICKRCGRHTLHRETK